MNIEYKYNINIIANNCYTSSYIYDINIVNIKQQTKHHIANKINLA